MAGPQKRSVEAQVISGIFKGVGFAVGLWVFGAVFCPWPSGMHEKKQQAMCSSNEKQLGLAILQYAQDNDGLMPRLSNPINPDVTWRNLIFPYVRPRDIYQCPSRHDTVAGTDGMGKSYAANDSGKGVFGRLWMKASKVDDFPAPESLIALCEVNGGDLPGFNIDTLASGAGGQVLWSGHMNGSNNLFADGHVKWSRPLDKQGRWYRDPHKPLSETAEAVLRDAQGRAGR